MVKLIKYLKNYKIEAILAPVFKLLEACFELLVPLVVARIIDEGIKNNNTTYILHMGVVLIVFAILGLAAAITAQYFSAKAAVGCATALRDDLFTHIMELSTEQTDTIGRSTLITRVVNDSNQIQNGVNLIFRLVLRSPIIVFGAMIMAATISVKESLIFFAVIVALSLIVFVIMSVTVKGYRQVQKKLDTVLGKTGENLTGVRVVRAFTSEKREEESFQDSNDELAKLQIGVGRISALMNPLTYAVINMGIITILYTGAVNISVGNLTQGQVVALINYMSQILVELLKIANLVINISKASACTHRINEIMSMSNSQGDGTLNAEEIYERVYTNHNLPVVSYDHVSFTYPGAASPTLMDISFDTMKGETVGIIGGTGCGKTTLVNLLTRYYDSSEGSVKIAGEEIKNISIKSIRQLVGIVEQKVRLFSGTIESNLRWGKQDANQTDMQNAIDIAQAKDVVDSKENGLASEVQALGRNLSGGQKQRISIARTLIRKPKILILDDSSSALDYATDARLREELKKNNADMTVFMVSQRVTCVRHADHILVLDDGHLVGDGTHEKLVKDCSVYREICLSQLSEEEVMA